MLTLTARAAGAYREKPADFVRGQASRQPWAWDGLCFAVPFDSQTSDGTRDAISGNRGVDNVSLTYVRDGRGNPSYDGYVAGGLRYLQYPDNPRNDSPSSALTVYARFRRIALGGAYAGICCNRYASIDPWITWGLYGDSAGTGKVAAGLTVNGVSTELAPTGVIPTTQYVSAFLRWRSGEAPRLDVLGERGDTITSAVHGSTLTGTLSYAAGEAIRINSTQDLNSGHDAEYSQVLAWGRKLTDIELASLVADPFGWYSPRRETVTLAGPFPVVGPPASVAALAGVSGAGPSIVPTIGASDVVTSYTVTAGPNVSATFERTVSGSTTSDVVVAGDTQVFPTGAAHAADVTFVSLTSDDTSV